MPPVGPTNLQISQINAAQAEHRLEKVEKPRHRAAIEAAEIIAQELGESRAAVGDNVSGKVYETDWLPGREIGEGTARTKLFYRLISAPSQITLQSRVEVPHPDSSRSEPISSEDTLAVFEKRQEPRVHFRLGDVDLIAPGISEDVNSHGLLVKPAKALDSESPRFRNIVDTLILLADRDDFPEDLRRRIEQLLPAPPDSPPSPEPQV